MKNSVSVFFECLIQFSQHFYKGFDEIQIRLYGARSRVLEIREAICSEKLSRKVDLHISFRIRVERQ